MLIKVCRTRKALTLDSFYGRFFVFAFLFALILIPAAKSFGQDEDIALYTPAGKPVAFLNLDNASSESEPVIYLWSGKPAAYLDASNVYGFNGKHLGWFKKGALYDHEGAVVGATESRFKGVVQIGPLEGLKQLTPLKCLEELAPLEPLFKPVWSDDSLALFLLQGAVK